MKKISLLPTGYLLIAMVMILLIHFIVPLARLIPILWNLVGILPLGFGI